MVNYVVLNSTPTAVNIIKKIKPNIYCKGPDYKDHQNDISGQIKKETDAVKKNGGKSNLLFTGDYKDPRCSKVLFEINQYIIQNNLESSVNISTG